MAKDTRLSIVIAAVDKATGPIRAIGARVAQLTSPLRGLTQKLGGLGSVGMSKLLDGFKAVGGAIGGILSKVPLIGGAIAAMAGGAVFALKSFVDEFAQLSDKSDAMGVSVDFLAQMRYAAEKSGASVEQLDSGLQGFVSSLGQARAGTGRMAAFMGKATPNLLRQVKAAKSNEEAFMMLARAMDKIEDPAKRAAFAQKVLGDASLAPLLNRGAGGIQKLREEYFKYAGSQKEAAEEAGKVDSAMKDLKASTDGIKGALVRGLAPALGTVVGKLKEWLVGHREDIAIWAKELGEKLPGAIEKIVSGIGTAISKMQAFFKSVAELVEMADVLINGDKGIEGFTPEEFLRGDTKSARMRNEMKGTENLSARQKLERSNRLFEESKALIGGPGEHSQRDSDIADVKREAAQKLRDQVPDADRMLREMRATFGAKDLMSSLAGARDTTAKVVVDFVNAPKGTRASTDPKSTADVDTKVGYQMEPAL